MLVLAAAAAVAAAVATVVVAEMVVTMMKHARRDSYTKPARVPMNEVSFRRVW